MYSEDTVDACIYLMNLADEQFISYWVRTETEASRR